ncbi:MAG: ferredoxin-NADP reductase [Gammaproteobacteria bacterium SG8_47]|nr:MAG: ferredoxin-NADP reductase [Gammaproteobacteria bacterium SG8_47]
MPYAQQHVTAVHPWSERIFSFRTTRPAGFEFQNGEFVMLGLRPEGKLIPRAYSIVSTNADEQLEFLSIQVPDGPLTSRLARVSEGSPIWINTKTTGSLTLEHVLPGRNLYMLATGTGLAPFMSLIRAGEVFDAFERVILLHTVRNAHGLAYREELMARTGDRFCYVPTVTREPFEIVQRGADLFRSGELSARLRLPPAAPEQDRVMLCGNPAMNREMSDYLKQNGWAMTNYQGVGNFTVEQAFVVPR